MHMWNKDDLELLGEWVEENKQAQISIRHGLPELNKLFPKRTNQSLYNKVRNIRLEKGIPLPYKISPYKGPRAGAKTLKQQLCPPKNAHSFLSLLDDFIDKESNRLAAEKTTAIQKELTELKTLMQKFTKARQAIMDVRL
jgi:hypothetical protein